LTLSKFKPLPDFQAKNFFFYFLPQAAAAAAVAQEDKV
jgi:hypothetical protein